MNTLSKEFTLGTFFNEDPENYVKLRKQWSKMVNSDVKDTLTVAHHILYLILIGRNWKKAITLPTNKNKIENHYKPRIQEVREWRLGEYQMDKVISAFEGTITAEMYKAARKCTDFDMSQDAYPN